MEKKIVIIGGGPAGLAAAISAYNQGEKDILLLERASHLGGILNQCIHNGFGLHIFNQELTGPEYADKYIKMFLEKDIPYLLNTMVISLLSDKEIIAVSKTQGLLKISAQAIIIATGSRERTRGAINIAGTRPAGLFTAGTAQHLINIDGYLPGKEVVILGSGDIGLIMARRLTLEGAKVKGVFELLPYSSGLNRNIVQCLNDFEIPLYYSHTIVNITGAKRIKSIDVAPVDENLQPQLEKIKTITCDTLLLSVGLIPENELTQMANVPISPSTNGAIVNEEMMSMIEGIFACGNALHIHDLVDYVSIEAEIAGKSAVNYLNKTQENKKSSNVTAGFGISYIVPQKITTNKKDSPLELKFRVKNIFHNAFVVLSINNQIIDKKRRRVLLPGEMETFAIKSKALKLLEQESEIIVSIEES